MMAVRIPQWMSTMVIMRQLCTASAQAERLMCVMQVLLMVGVRAA